MTAVPHLPTHLLTIDEYSAMGEDEGRTELLEGVLVMSPSPTSDHKIAGLDLGAQVRTQLPDHLIAVPDIDIDLQLAPADQPGFSRRPDLVVVQRQERLRTRREGGLLRASEIVLVVEIVSPGSRRTDHVIKRSEYADAGIPHYWIVDLDEPVSLLACHRTEEFGYVDGGTVSGTFTTGDPFPLRLDLDTLLD